MGAAHGKGQVCLGKGRGIVDAVAHHGRRAGASLHFAEDAQLVFWQQIALSLRDTGLRCDGGYGGAVVAAQHHGLHAHHLQLAYGIGRLRTQRVGNGEDGVYRAFIGEQRDSVTLLFVALQRFFQGFAGNAHFAHQAEIAQHIARTVNGTRHAPARQRLYILRSEAGGVGEG
ncbi:hypothetical protein D3C72_1382300 [compost metagenome]